MRILPMTPVDVGVQVEENRVTVLGAVTSGERLRTERPILHVAVFESKPPKLYIQNPHSNLEYWIQEERDEIVVIERARRYYWDSLFVTVWKLGNTWMFKRGNPYDHIEGRILKEGNTDMGEVVHGLKLLDWLLHYKRNNPLGR